TRRSSDLAALELVDEQRERAPVVELEPAYVEGHPRKVGELSRAAAAMDALDAPVQWRQRARDALHSPDSVELTHVSRVPRGARTKRSLSPHGGPARQGAARGRRLAVRAEVGRVPRPARARRR